MKFKYKAKNNEGETIKGVLESNSHDEAASLLKEKRLYVVDLKEEGTKSQFEKIFQKKVTVKDKIVFTEQLGIMIKSGLSIIEALEALQEETVNKYFGSQIAEVIVDVQGGTPLSKALEKHQDSFSEIYISMIKSGEESGKLDVVFQRLSVQLGKEYDLTRKIRGALAYPVFVLVALVIVMIIILTFVIPQLKLIFDDAGVPLPLLTRAVMGLSMIIKNYGIYIFAFLAIIVVLLIRFKKTEKGKHIYDSLIIKLPVFGTLLKKTYMARFTRSFAALISAGLPLLDVLRVTGNTIGNVLYKKEIENMTVSIKSGQPISQTLKKSPLFPKMIGQLAIVGEKSGSLDEVFDTLANFFERDVDNITSNLSALLEPILMVVLAVGIGLVIVSVLQPIYGLVNAI